MLRLRRYRLFLVLAVFAVIAFYQFTNFGHLGSSGTNSTPGLNHINSDNAGTIPATKSTTTSENDPEVHEPATKDIPTTTRPVDVSNSDKDVKSKASSFKATATPIKESDALLSGNSTSINKDQEHEESQPAKNTTSASNKSDQVAESPAEPVEDLSLEGSGQGRFETTTDPDVEQLKIHWSRLPEHFPVPTASLIPVPTGKVKALPKVQHVFSSDESAAEKAELEKKRDRIKKTFEFSWQGYRKNAWLQDELSPVSGKYRNPFCGWAATLVDSLDTLWMLDLKEDFEEATKAVEKIDFTTSIRNDLPLFEITIRYLGGLVAAYDISGSKYKLLLDKAVELAEILMGAFDTPNRMPMTFYLWKPTFASQPHRAKTRVVLAEIGSLSVEFTRLAQITGEDKYYDAIARITNEFESWQNATRMPGLWPKSVDASGCKKPETPQISALDHSIQKGPGYYNAQAPQMPDTTNSTEMVANSNVSSAKGNNTDEASAVKSSSVLETRQLSDDDVPLSAETPKPDCVPQGLNSPPNVNFEEFTLGGMADSVYEYLPKEYMLLGGLEPQYQSMYEAAADAAKKHLLFRPMIQDEKRNILFSGQVLTSGRPSRENDVTLKPEGTHLTCFAGGMFAVGAKLFDRKDDLDIAKRLTDGCIWSYEMTPTGIMPEHFQVIPCDNQEKCPFNETLWFEKLDPYHPRSRSRNTAPQEILDEDQRVVLPSVAATIDSTASLAPTSTVAAEGTQISSSRRNKRQLGGVDNDKQVPEVEGPAAPVRANETKTESELSLEKASKAKEDTSKAEGTATATIKQEEPEPEPEPVLPVIAAYTPPPIPSQEEYAKARIRDEKLPGGVTRISGSKYILRPEAIESVFIMYRITGDNYWREKGWDMFTAIQNSTQAEYGASAIADVMNETPFPLDEMESFWLAETLKYFYLLFSDPDYYSLDDYVLNTEAHPFKRPK